MCEESNIQKLRAIVETFLSRPPLWLVGIDILVPLPEAKQMNMFVVVIMDRNVVKLQIETPCWRIKDCNVVRLRNKTS